MGFLSGLFGESKEKRALREAIEGIHRLIEDEAFQLDALDPAIRPLIERGHAYDKDPNGSGPFGFLETNPIPVNGPIGQLAYLSKLETSRGERILFHRIGAIDRVDVFEAVTFSGSEWFLLFTDLYHPRRSRLAPEGFRFVKDVAQFSGFHRFCQNFPYDFVEMKQTERESSLSIAYIPISRVSEQIERRAFERPLSHKVKIELVRSRLTSMLAQQ